MVALVLALTLLGVETAILSVVVGATACDAAATFALLVGLGGWEMGGETAVGPSLWRLISIGDDI